MDFVHKPTALATDKVFDVVGEMLPSNALENMFREMYARRLDVTDISDRIPDAAPAGSSRFCSSCRQLSW